MWRWHGNHANTCCFLLLGQTSKHFCSYELVLMHCCCISTLIGVCECVCVCKNILNGCDCDCILPYCSYFCCSIDFIYIFCSPIYQFGMDFNSFYSIIVSIRSVLVFPQSLVSVYFILVISGLLKLIALFVSFKNILGHCIAVGL